MLLKDIKLTLINILLLYIVVFFVWLVIGFFAMGYEGGTDNSNLGFYCYKIAGLLVFSKHFWFKILQSSILATHFSLFTTTAILYVVYIIGRKLL